MEPSPNSLSVNDQLSLEERTTLETEYGIAFSMLQMLNAQIWQTFAVVSTLALAGLAFYPQVKTNIGGAVTWPASVGLGLAMISILVGWLMLANRWRNYANIQMYRMTEIEIVLGMYLIRETLWLRKPLTQSQIAELNEKDRSRYESVNKAFPQFPRFRWRQEVLTSIIIGALVLIWLLVIIAGVL